MTGQQGANNEETEPRLLQCEARLLHEREISRQLHAISCMRITNDARDEIFERILDAAITIMNADFASVQVLDHKHKTLHLVGWRNFHPKSAAFWREVSVEAGATCGAALLHGERVIVPDVNARGLDFGESADHYRLCGIRAIQSTPLSSRQGVLVGMISTHWRTTNTPSDDDLRYLDTLARLAADIIDRNRREAELRESGNRFRSIFEHVATGIAIISIAGQFEQCSPAYCAILGYSEGELRGRSFETLIHAGDREAKRAQMQRLISQEISSFELENRCINKSGEIVWLHKFVSLLPDESGKPAHIIQLVTDITERRRRDTESADARRLEAIGQLAGGIAHDFNNLLAVIAGNLELAIQRDGDAEMRQLLSRAHEAAEFGISFNHRLLSLTRQRALEPVAVNMNGRIEAAVKLLQRVLGESVRIRSELASDLWTVCADVGEIDSALFNLVANARDAMPDGGEIVMSTMNITLSEEETKRLNGGARGDDYVRLTVLDDGVGMSEEVLRRAAEPFFTTKSPGKGTGLGLTSVANFARQAGGFITIASIPGDGCVVSIYLPRSLQAQVLASPRLVSAGLPLGDGELVLVVEDDARVREVTLRRIESLGYAVIEARSGSEAIQVLKASPHIRVVLSDIVMPGGMSGYDLARWIQANKPAIGVVLTSGYNEGDRGADDATAPFDGKVLAKPSSREALARALDDALLSGSP